MTEVLGQLAQRGGLIRGLHEPPEAVAAQRAGRQRVLVAQRAREASPRSEGPRALRGAVVVAEQEGRHVLKAADPRDPRTSGNPLLRPPGGWPHSTKSRSRPTAPATATRPDTPSLANTLVRWLSIVFSDRNSSPAISRLVRPSATSWAISRSRPLRLASPAAPCGARRRRPTTRWPRRRSSRAASSRRRAAPMADRSASARSSHAAAAVRSPAAAAARPAVVRARAATT